MRVNYGAIFQRMSKDKKMSGLVNVPLDKSLWPDSWKKVYYKIYDRFEKIILPQPVPCEYVLDIYTKRSTVEDYSPKPINFQTISNILYYSAGEVRPHDNHNMSRRAQPSAGARYPIELYILNFIEGDLKVGVYHYNVRDHALEYLWPFPILDNNTNYRDYYMGIPYVEKYAMAIVSTAVVDRTVMKYGERGYKYIYIEAGAILNNISLNATANKIGTLICGSTNEIEIEELLDIDGESETVILGIILGHNKDNANI